MANTEKVMKALECCANNGHCHECEYGKSYENDCMATLCADTIKVINNLQATVDILARDVSYKNCNSCKKKKTCEYAPGLGKQVRSNCMFFE